MEKAKERKFDIGCCIQLILHAILEKKTCIENWERRDGWGKKKWQNRKIGSNI